MGKQDSQNNIPANPSLSHTLPHLKSFVELETVPYYKDQWEPLEIPGAKPFHLTHHAKERFINHLEMLKTFFNYDGHFIIRSTNNFPLGSGLASSASSFAALTKCACLAMSELTHKDLPDNKTQANLSRLGSGSSCRSFFSPWALWDNEEVGSIELPYSDLIHHVIIISDSEKEVSSKAAHLEIETSPNYTMRPARARERLKDLLVAIKEKNWPQMHKLCLDEFIDMHELFNTSLHPFSYIDANTQKALDELESFWDEHQDGPLVTMDAGPNIHLLFRKDQAEMAKFYVQEYLVNQYDFL